jgi:hypothetical protein
MFSSSKNLGLSASLAAARRKRFSSWRNSSLWRPAYPHDATFPQVREAQRWRHFLSSHKRTFYPHRETRPCRPAWSLLGETFSSVRAIPPFWHPWDPQEVKCLAAPGIPACWPHCWLWRRPLGPLRRAFLTWISEFSTGHLSISLRHLQPKLALNTETSKKE